MDVALTRHDEVILHTFELHSEVTVVQLAEITSIARRTLQRSHAKPLEHGLIVASGELYRMKKSVYPEK